MFELPGKGAKAFACEDDVIGEHAFSVFRLSRNCVGLAFLNLDACPCMALLSLLYLAPQLLTKHWWCCSSVTPWGKTPMHELRACCKAIPVFWMIICK